MNAYFDRIIDRSASSGSYSSKWQDIDSNFREYSMEGALPMWVADMDFLCPPQVIQAVQKRAEHGLFGYASQESVEMFQKAAADWCFRRHEWRVEWQWMIFIPAVVPAISATVQEFTRPGDGVVIQPPVYHPFRKSIINNGRVVLENPLIPKGDSYEMDFQQLEEIFEEKHPQLLILCSPHNPVGRVWTKEELCKIRSLCQQYGVLIFSDEIHGDLIFPGFHHTPLGRLDEAFGPKHITAISPSKTFNIAGLQASLLVVPDETIRRRIQARIVANRLPYSNIFGPIAGEAAYRCGDYYVDSLMDYIAGNFQYAYNEIEKAQTGIRFCRTEGTYLAWADLKGTGFPPAEAYRKVLEEAHIAVDLGKWFGTGGDGFIRLNFACPRSLMEKAVEQLKIAFRDEKASKP